MELQMITGCTYNSLTIDGEDEINLTEEQRKEVKRKVCDWLNEHAELNTLLQYVIDYHGEYESLGHCEQCGDFIDKYTLNI